MEYNLTKNTLDKFPQGKKMQTSCTFELSEQSVNFNLLLTTDFA